jgi:hypothetical protein
MHSEYLIEHCIIQFRPADNAEFDACLCHPATLPEEFLSPGRAEAREKVRE